MWCNVRMPRAMPPLVMGVVLLTALAGEASAMPVPLLPDILPVKIYVDAQNVQEDAHVDAQNVQEDILTKDAIFMGFMTFAGLAMFSATLSRFRNIDESAPKRRYGAAWAVFIGAAAMVSISLGAAAVAHNFDTDSTIAIIWLLFLAGLVYLIGSAILHLSRDSNTREQK